MSFNSHPRDSPTYDSAAPLSPSYTLSGVSFCSSNISTASYHSSSIFSSNGPMVRLANEPMVMLAHSVSPSSIQTVIHRPLHRLPSSSPMYSCGDTVDVPAEAALESVEYDDQDVQPLDLSVRSTQAGKSLKRNHTGDHLPVCMFKSCSSDQTKFRPQTYSPTFRQHTGSPMIEKDDLIYHRPNTAVNAHYSTFNSVGNTGVNSASFNYQQDLEPLTMAANSPYKNVPITDKVSKSGHFMFRPCENPNTSYPNFNPRDLIQKESLHSSSLSEMATCTESEKIHFEKINLKSLTDRFGNTYEPTNLQQKNININEKSNNTIMQGLLTVNYDIHPNQNSSPALEVERFGKSMIAEKKNLACFVGGVISHTSLEKNQAKVAQPYRLSPDYVQMSQDSECGNHIPRKPLSPPAAVTSSTGPLVSQASSRSKAEPCLAQSRDSSDDCSTTCQSTNNSAQNLQLSLLSQPSSQSPQQDLTVRRRHTNPEMGTLRTKVTPSSRRSPLNKTSSSYLQSTSPTSTSSENTPQTEANINDNSMSHPTVYCENSKNSNKISLLDFWISKILMERSLEPPSSGKPCNVDYICTASGEKRIRLRLVDLMELQVEHSLKA